MRDILKLTKSVVLWHAGIATLHGIAHLYGGVSLPLWGILYVTLVITLAPLLALRMIYRRQTSAGMWLLTLSMLGALLFGVVHHFIWQNPDHVSHVHQGQWFFFITSTLVAVSECAGVWVGLAGINRLNRLSGAM